MNISIFIQFIYYQKEKCRTEKQIVFPYGTVLSCTDTFKSTLEARNKNPSDFRIADTVTFYFWRKRNLQTEIRFIPLIKQ